MGERWSFRSCGRDTDAETCPREVEPLVFELLGRIGTVSRASSRTHPGDGQHGYTIGNRSVTPVPSSREVFAEAVQTNSSGSLDSHHLSLSRTKRYEKDLRLWRFRCGSELLVPEEEASRPTRSWEVSHGKKRGIRRVAVPTLPGV